MKLEGNNSKCNNYDNDTIKYKKTIKSSSYYFIDDELTINNYSNKNQNNFLNDKDFINFNNNNKSKKDCNRILNLKLDINNMNKTFNEIKKRNKSTSKKNIN